jgi:hypothetical protein
VNTTLCAQPFFAHFEKVAVDTTFWFNRMHYFESNVGCWYSLTRPTHVLFAYLIELMFRPGFTRHLGLVFFFKNVTYHNNRARGATAESVQREHQNFFYFVSSWLVYDNVKDKVDQMKKKKGTTFTFTHL